MLSNDRDFISTQEMKLKHLPAFYVHIVVEVRYISASFNELIICQTKLRTTMEEFLQSMQKLFYYFSTIRGFRNYGRKKKKRKTQRL